MANPFQHNPFQPSPAGGSEPFGAQQPPQQPAPPREANALATLSVVFAFVFAPAGLILGHLGLAQIRHSGQRGRDRALVGLTLSYTFITALVVALIVGAMLPDAPPARTAAPTTTTTPPAPPPPPPTVAPAGLDGLLPSLDDAKNMTGDNALTVDETHHQIVPAPHRRPIDREDCRSVFELGAPEAYDTTAVVGYSDIFFVDNHDLMNQWSFGGGVASYQNATAAQAELSKLLGILRQCGGATINETYPGNQIFPLSVQPPADAGKGITIVETLAQTPPQIYGSRAIVAKDNVFVDIGVWTTSSSDRSRQVVMAMANHILGKIPG